MGVQKAKDFLVQIATDEGAAKKARAAHEASLLKLAGEMGYTFGADDLRSAMAEVEDLDELSGAELKGVAGGMISRVTRRRLDS